MANTNKKSNDEYQKVLDGYRTLIATSRPSVPTAKRTSIDDELAREKKLHNDDAEQDIQLKRKTLNRLFLLLAIETFFIFAFAFMQATELLSFQLEEWSFKLLTTVTIMQITIMLTVAVNYLFPKKK